MTLRAVLVLPFLFACSSAPDGPSDVARRELAPTGKLRFGVVAAPAATEFFVARRADGEPQGVSVDLARELGRRLGAPVEFVVVSSSGELTEPLAAGKLDAAFMPPDEAPRVPGARILEGSFNKVGVGLAIPKNRPNALAYVTAFTEEAKASGLVRQAFDRNGFKASKVAGPGER